MNNFVILNKKEYILDLPCNSTMLSEDWFLITNDCYEQNHDEERTILVFGDYIGSTALLLSTKEDDIPKLKGNFYALVLKDGKVKVFSSFFNMLPLYSTEDKTMIASSLQLIETYYSGVLTINKRFILENLLFNYGLFNGTKYKEVVLMPCHHYVLLTADKLHFQRHFDTTSFFTETPSSGTKVVSDLSNLFVETTKDYFPDANFAIAFTGGFDGRTLVSCAMHHKQTFDTFSFGRPENSDVSIPSKNAQELGIPYRFDDLGGKEYVEEHYFEHAKKFSKAGSCGNGLLYAHFSYNAQKVSEQADYLLSGACGSELFRALHIRGAVTSAALADIFSTEDEQLIQERLRTSPVLKALRLQDFEEELDALVLDVLRYKRALPKKYTLNQQFYVFVFEEVFRKFFGQWIVAQQQYLKVRTPFLDFNFVKTLLQTAYAGANNDFFTNHPFKRRKGQMIYADIIRKTNRRIYKQQTGKGYAPRAVRNPFFSYQIFVPFFKKRFKRKLQKTYLDNLGIVSGILHNSRAMEKLISGTTLFDQKELTKLLNRLTAYTPESQRDLLAMSLSLLYNLQKKQQQQKQPIV